MSGKGVMPCGGACERKPEAIRRGVSGGADAVRRGSPGRGVEEVGGERPNPRVGHGSGEPGWPPFGIDTKRAPRPISGDLGEEPPGSWRGECQGGRSCDDDAGPTTKSLGGAGVESCSKSKVTFGVSLPAGASLKLPRRPMPSLSWTLPFARQDAEFAGSTQSSESGLPSSILHSVVDGGTIEPDSISHRSDDSSLSSASSSSSSPA